MHGRECLLKTFARLLFTYSCRSWKKMLAHVVHDWRWSKVAHSSEIFSDGERGQVWGSLRMKPRR